VFRKTCNRETERCKERNLNREKDKPRVPTKRDTQGFFSGYRQKQGERRHRPQKHCVGGTSRSLQERGGSGKKPSSVASRKVPEFRALDKQGEGGSGTKGACQAECSVIQKEEGAKHDRGSRRRGVKRAGLLSSHLRHLWGFKTEKRKKHSKGGGDLGDRRRGHTTAEERGATSRSREFFELECHRDRASSRQHAHKQFQEKERGKRNKGGPRKRLSQKKELKGRRKKNTPFGIRVKETLWTYHKKSNS